MGRSTSGLTATLCLLSVLVCPGTLTAADIEGQVVIPASPTGWTPALTGHSVRVQGTKLSAPVDASTGSFVLSDVPNGAVTLLLVEPAGSDVFTQASKRVVTVSGASDVTFNLAYHWQQFPTYPAPWLSAGYETWTPWFVSESVGFILFKVNSASPARVELYRTLDGGGSWAEIGHWVRDDAQYNAGTQNYPTGDSVFFVNGSSGVVFTATGCSPCGGCGNGFFRTDNGGASWSFVALPLVDTAYSVTIDRYAAFNSTHWIAAGRIGCSVQGYGSGFRSVIWETTDAGASWQVVHAFTAEISCTGLAANGDGDAVAFWTPYGNGDRRVSIRSGGSWETTPDGTLVVNSGYGPADLPMLDDTVWASSQGGALPNGLYRSDSAGAGGTWSKVSDAAVQYMAFASRSKAFGLFGGQAKASYDGGATWLTQSAGGGYCCHGNNIFAFDPIRAVWQDGGASDPDGHASLFTYQEPAVANFELLPGVTLVDSLASPGSTNVPLASLKVLSHGPIGVRLQGLSLEAVGTGTSEIAQLKLWLDTDAGGYVSTDDQLLGQGNFNSSGMVTINAGNLQPDQLVPAYLLVTVDVAANAAVGTLIGCSLPVADAQAVTADTQEPIVASAPVGQALTSRLITIAETVFADGFEDGFGQWAATTEDTQPDDGYGWIVSGAAAANGSHSAYIHEDRGHDGWARRHFLTLASPIALPSAGSYYLTFNHQYALDPSVVLHVEVSIDGGASWRALGSYGSVNGWASHTTGAAFVHEAKELVDAGGLNLLVRFQMDWTAGWYFNATWAVDDVRIYRVTDPPPVDDGSTTDPGTPTHPETPPDPDTPTNSGDDDPGDPDTPTNSDDQGDSGTQNPGAGGDQDGDGETVDESGEDNSSFTAPAPACGFGVIEPALFTLFLLMAMRRRS